MIRGKYNAAPAALCYEAYEAADKRDVEFLICDTAGRLHTKSNLMGELAKVKRSLSKHDSNAPHEILLVVDATTGSNALAQAKQFHEAIGLTGLIVTKLDGSGKGGVVVAIQDELGRSEEHTSELQSQSNLVCRLLLEKKKHVRRA